MTPMTLKERLREVAPPDSNATDESTEEHRELATPHKYYATATDE
jgi:hypothetical protein